MAFVLNRTLGPILSRQLLQRLITTTTIEQQYRFRSRSPFNTVVLFVPQQEAWVVERMGKFYKTLSPGLNFLLPIFDTIRYVQSLKEIAIEIPSQTAISKDNVTLSIDGVLYLKVFDPYLASYGVEDAEFAVTQLAQTTMRSEIGKITLDTLFRERELLNAGIVEAINKAAKAWGIDCLRYEIRDIRLPPKVQEAMQMQVEAERRKRATILESEGIRESQINKAEGTKQAAILASEGFKLEQINNANGEAEAIRAKATARAQALQLVSDRLQSEEGRNAASLEIAEQYVHAFGNLARTNNTILLPTNTGDMSSMIASALAIYSNLQSKDRQGFLSQPTTTTSQTSPSSTPMIESSPLPNGSKPTSDLSAIRRAKKPTTEKDT
jgi:regulator of protease activity HflC (stomatin/prohibitin superfamily)